MDLADQNLQSDERFAERFIASRAARRYGPVRIRGELSSRGVDPSVAEIALAEADIDWQAVASEALARMSGNPSDFASRARLSRKLYQRGFPRETVDKVLSQAQ